MNFKLNKINLDITRMLQEQNYGQKIHNSANISSSNDYIQGNKKYIKNYKKENQKSKQKGKQKKIITVEGIKCGKSVDVQAEKNGNIYDEGYMGQILDLEK